MLVVAVVLHAAVLPQLRVAGVAPDVLLLVGIAAGITTGPGRGAAVGFVAGLLADAFLQSPFGLSALSYCVVAYGVGTFNDTVLPASRWVVVGTAMVASALGVILFAVIGAVVGQTHLLSDRLVTVTVVVALVNGLLAPAALPALRWATTADRVRVRR